MKLENRQSLCWRRNSTLCVRAREPIENDDKVRIGLME